jgi:peptide/nickel transport system ATP-binding protein
VLEGDIPSAMNPPPGCPFQTRCRYKSLVPGGLCDIEVPPVRNLGGGHQVKCHLPDAVFAGMEPVISFARDDDDDGGTPGSGEGHGMPGAGPGFVGEPPRRPRGKTASPEAAAEGEGFDESEASARLRREDARDGRSETGQADTSGDLPLQVGWGSQADDPNVPSPFARTAEEIAEDEATRKDRTRH